MRAVSGRHRLYESIWGFQLGRPQTFRIFFTPPVRKFTEPPLLRLLTMSAIEDTPSSPQCGRPKWKPHTPYFRAKKLYC